MSTEESEAEGTSGSTDGPSTEALGTWELPTFDATLTRPRLAAAADLPAGRRVGPYRIERVLGHGGMGAVYLAVRDDDTFEKRVALKVARGALASPDAVERFKRERQILARLEHPNIARLLDGGATEDGSPFFVMEHIEGKPIQRYCDERRLDTHARLRLFLLVCAAVEHAHRSLVVHRDIKPANILVTADGVPRLLDFGIAKLLEEGAGAAPTEVTSLAFTPFYASPEQVQGEPVGLATDVYSLGVLLYELLTGHGPYRLATYAPLEVMKAIVEQEPEAPSAAVDRTVRYTAADGRGQAALTPHSVSLPREGTPERLRYRLRGDLDAILMMALRKEPARRYATVEAFAEDVRRYLGRRPVLARPDHAWYRAGKFVRRHRLALLAGAAVVGALVAGAASHLIQSREVARERDRAERVSRFLVEIFTVSDPSEARGNTVTAREVLDRGAERIENDLKEQPEVRADLLETIANVYGRLGLYERAAKLAREALAFRRESGGRDPAALARSLNLLGNVLMDHGDYAGAEAAHREALERRRALHGADSREVSESLNNLAAALDSASRFEEAEALLTESLEIKRRTLPPEDQRIATTLLNLGVNRYKRGDLPGARERVAEALRIQRQAFGPDHPEVAFTLQSLGVLEDEQGRYAEAEKTYREALAIQRKVLGREHPDIVTTLTNLGNTLAHAGRLSEAAAVYEEALPMSRTAFGPESADTASVLAGWADVARRQRRLREAEERARAALAIREGKFGPDHTDTAEARVLLGQVLLDAGQVGEAEDLLRRGLATLESRPSLEARRKAAREALDRLERQRAAG